MECWCPHCTRPTGSKGETFCGLCKSEKCNVEHGYCRHLWGWELVWLFYGMGIFVGADPAVPWCRHEKWRVGKDPCCGQVRAAVDARAAA